MNELKNDKKKVFLYDYLKQKNLEIIKHKNDKFLYDLRHKDTKTIILQGTTDTLDEMIKDFFNIDF